MSIISARLGKEEVVQLYSLMAPVYDVWGMLTESKARRKALASAHIQDGETVMEVAIGTGLTFQEIVKSNPNGYSVGVDLTPAMLHKARMRMMKIGSSRYQISVGDAYDLQFPDHHFDVLMNNYMFDLLPERDFIPVLEEFRRILKPTGRIVLVNMTKGIRFYQHFWETLYRLNPRWLGGCRGVLLTQSVQAAGFSNVRREMVSQFGFPSEIISAMA
ncbi:demethylmenaquinone methyltransferase / 2-methoxy-6-polyprenyl-1,4-benzoquinol methylase [Anaerolineae bacterium]|nr:demethylmenaquinone methyltransferase / 2-methoxy-6-polyprenyl-1,4-benzoquinol methylase [Anaerolineae bacterium]